MPSIGGPRQDFRVRDAVREPEPFRGDAFMAADNDLFLTDVSGIVGDMNVRISGGFGMHQAASGKLALGSCGIVLSFCSFSFYCSPGLELCIAHWFYLNDRYGLSIHVPHFCIALKVLCN
jgi:hypothetical protein